ncbi:hypothetical protein [Gemmiger formicilis]|uniref:hypothetical protein n=1 Tax=Gemmiger formicilis TaxID=745368 RepID=UPI003520EFA9
MTQSQQLRKLAARSATAFLLAALCVFPLYIDKFSNLGVVKFTGICTLSWAFALWLGALACVGARPDPGRLPWKADPALWALGAVTASGVVSTVLSLSPGASFWGLGGYYGGCMMVLFTAAGYLAVRAFAPQKILNGLTFCVGVTTALVTVLYVLNIFNIDLIGTYADTAVVERAQFFSTLGQKNFCSGFMAFALPLVFYAFLVARGPRHTVFYGIPAFFGGLALAVVDAEGLMLGVGVAALVLICQKNFTTRTLRRLAVIGAFFFFHAGWMQYMRTHVYTQGGKPMLAALGHVAQRGFVVCLVVWAALYFGLRGRELPLYRPGRVLAGGIVAGAAVLTLLANCVPGFPSSGPPGRCADLQRQLGHLPRHGLAHHGGKLAGAARLAQAAGRRPRHDAHGGGRLGGRGHHGPDENVLCRPQRISGAAADHRRCRAGGVAVVCHCAPAQGRAELAAPRRSARHAGAGQLPGPCGHFDSRVDDLPGNYAAFRAFAGVLPAGERGCRGRKGPGKAWQKGEARRPGESPRSGQAMAAAHSCRCCDDGSLRRSVAGDFWVFVLNGFE